jgi:hypothetical protein
MQGEGTSGRRTTLIPGNPRARRTTKRVVARMTKRRDQRRGGTSLGMYDDLGMKSRMTPMYPPNVHRGQISKIWPDFQNLTRGVYLWPPQMSNIPPS